VLYTAPATIVAKQSVGGYQLLPNDHIFNTNISGLPTRADSGTLISGAGTLPVGYLPSFPLNYVNGSTPTDALSFFYTSPNNGTFQSPQWPAINLESGWFDAISGNSNNDHHVITIDTTNGNLGERYQYYAQAAVTSCTVNGSNSATCTITPTNTSPGFARAAAVGANVQVGGFTGGDTYLNGSFVMTAAAATSITFNITHAAASSSTAGQATMNTQGGGCSTAGTCNSQSGIKYTYADYPLPANASTDAAGMMLEPLTLHTQELVNACLNGAAINHALRMTLQNGFLHNAFLWPATTSSSAGSGVNFYGERVRLKAAFAIGTFSACAQVLLTQMKNYGLIIADGGTGWQVQVEGGNIPSAEVAILQEINSANIATSNWEVVDESGLMETSSSGAANNGEVVTYTSSTGTVTTHVNLQGAAVNVNNSVYYIMAGTPGLQLATYSAAGGVTCSISPAVGSITSGCVYTAPASAASVTKTTVTVTSSVNTTVKTAVLVYVLPASARFIQDVADYTDSFGNVWYSGAGYGIGMTNVPAWSGCCQNDGSFASITDKQLWWNRLFSSFTGGDYKIDLYAPAGPYQITFRNGTTLASGTDFRNFYSQGTLIATIDSTTAAGGLHLPFTQTANVSVGSDNKLSFYNVGIGRQTNNTGDISSISIIPGAAAQQAGRLP
jgi:hypothetical protein